MRKQRTGNKELLTPYTRRRTRSDSQERNETKEHTYDKQKKTSDIVSHFGVTEWTAQTRKRRSCNLNYENTEARSAGDYMERSDNFGRAETSSNNSKRENRTRTLTKGSLGERIPWNQTQTRLWDGERAADTVRWSNIFYMKHVETRESRKYIHTHI